MGFLCGEDGSYHLPGDLEATINNLGPLLATVERAHDAAPILNIIACRRGERDRHAEAIATFKQRKRAAIVSEFNTFLSQGRLGLDGVVLQEILEG
jgi:hypothetical protein